jgi:hypothetical protein
MKYINMIILTVLSIMCQHMTLIDSLQSVSGTSIRFQTETKSSEIEASPQPLSTLNVPKNIRCILINLHWYSRERGRQPITPSSGLGCVDLYVNILCSISINIIL